MNYLQAMNSPLNVSVEKLTKTNKDGEFLHEFEKRIGWHEFSEKEFGFHLELDNPPKLSIQYKKATGKQLTPEQLEKVKHKLEDGVQVAKKWLIAGKVARGLLAIAIIVISWRILLPMMIFRTLSTLMAQMAKSDLDTEVVKAQEVLQSLTHEPLVTASVNGFKALAPVYELESVLTSKEVKDWENFEKKVGWTEFSEQTLGTYQPLTVPHELMSDYAKAHGGTHMSSSQYTAVKEFIKKMVNSEKFKRIMKVGAGVAVTCFLLAPIVVGAYAISVPIFLMNQNKVNK